MRVFWPSKAVKSVDTTLELIGWQNSEQDFVVAAAVPKGCSRDCYRECLESCQIKCGKAKIIGVFQGKPDDLLTGHNAGYFFQVCTVQTGSRGLQLLLEPPGELIMYTPPNTRHMSYLSLRPIQLQELPCPENNLISRIKGHCVAPPANSDQYGDILESSITQINMSRTLIDCLQNYCAKDGASHADHPSGGHPRGSPTKYENMAMTLILVLRKTLNVLIIFLESSVLSRLATSQQLRLRLRRTMYIPDQWLAARSGGQNEEYIRLNNGLWLGANDVILGVYIGQLIRYYCPLLSPMISTSIQHVGVLMNSLVLWLMSWPAGLKLNTQLALFFGEILVWVISAWHKTLAHILTADNVAILLTLLSYTGYAGLTLQIALVSDLLSLLTLYLSCFYHASARIYRGQLLLLGALFRVFRGKKWNKLRRRVDSGDYDLAQLLLGTILFIVALFLFPTVTAFYVAFVTIRMAVVMVFAVIELALAFLNHFPLFPLLLRLKSPGRVPGGIRVSRLNETTLVLSSRPIASSDLFAQYNSALHHLSDHYLSWPFLSGLLTGERVSGHRAELYSVLESMVPQKLMTTERLRDHLKSL